MANDENQAGERNNDAINSNQQKESTNESRRTATEKEVTQEHTKSDSRRDVQKREQEIRNDQKEPKRRTSGREGWGGYQGY